MEVNSRVIKSYKKTLDLRAQEIETGLSVLLPVFLF